MAVLMPLKDQSAVELLQNNLAAKGGHYLLGANMHWHGGMHFTINKPVQAIADGKLIAYRLSTDYITADLPNSGNNANKYSNSFALIQHEAKVKGRTLNYYSLYMHLMPASGYKAAPNMAIPDFIRAMKDDDQDATITASGDIPGGLNIRHLKTGKIVVIAPIGSEVTLDENNYTEAELTRYSVKIEQNLNYKTITFIDHDNKTHNGYALLDKDRAIKNNNKYTIITQEDPIKSSDVNQLKGLRLRSKQNFDHKTIVKIIKKGAKVKVQIINNQWAKVKEIDGVPLDSESFIYYKGLVKFDKNDINENLLDSIQSHNQPINAGDLLGNPGLNFSQSNALHFEIFTDDSIVDFIKDHKDLSLSDKNILQVNKGSHLFQRKTVDVPKAVATIKKYSRVKIEDDAIDTEYVKITATDLCAVVSRDDLKEYNAKSSEYKGIKSNLEKYKAKFNNDLNENSVLKFIYYTNSEGAIKTYKTSDEHRLVALPIPELNQKTYWVKRDLIETIDGKKQRAILFKSLNALYKENPIKFIFQEESLLGSSDEALIDLATSKSFQHSDGKTWYEVTLPFDNKALLQGVNRTAQEKGWVKQSNTVLTAALNWPGFSIAKEKNKGVGNKDAQIDLKNLTPFFKELFEDIGISSDGAISAQEMKAALKDDILAKRLSGIIVKHPSEWQADASLSKWQYLKDIISNDAVFEEAKTQIKNLTWWDDAKEAGAGLPSSSEVYHLNPVAAIEQLVLISKGKGIGYNTYENSVDLLTNWSKGFERQISKQNDFNSYLLEAGKAYPKIDLLVFKSIIAQESNFKNLARNNVGYAGLTQVGWKPWLDEAKFSLGESSKGRLDETGEYYYDLISDERFNSAKSILGGMRVLYQKIIYLDGKIKHHNPTINILERYKLYIASYNGGQGTIGKCLIAANKSGIKTPVFDNFLSSDPRKSILWNAIPESWGRAAKYKEISEYVEHVIKRVEQ